MSNKILVEPMKLSKKWMMQTSIETRSNLIYNKKRKLRKRKYHLASSYNSLNLTSWSILFWKISFLACNKLNPIWLYIVFKSNKLNVEILKNKKLNHKASKDNKLNPQLIFNTID